LKGLHERSAFHEGVLFIRVPYKVQFFLGVAAGPVIPRLLFVVLIEVASIHFIVDSRQVGCSLLPNAFPRDSFEPLMAKDFFDSVVSQTGLLIGDKLEYQILGFTGKAWFSRKRKMFLKL
jgi:hypothetical protein